MVDVDKLMETVVLAVIGIMVLNEVFSEVSAAIGEFLQ
jgi:hypothetical protein